jgi:hypothetical protein
MASGAVRRRPVETGVVGSWLGTGFPGKHHQADAGQATGAMNQVAPGLAQPGPPVVQLAPTLDHTVRDLHAAGHSQRSIARDLNLGRRKVKQILDREAA